MYPTATDVAEIWRYNGGELGVRHTVAEPAPSVVRWDCRTVDDLMALALWLTSLPTWKQSVRHVYIPYLPYARQDRQAVDNDCLPLPLLGKMLVTNSPHSPRIWTLDAHSKVSAALVNSISPIEHILAYADDLLRDLDAIVCPDYGAREKVQEYARALDLPVLYMGKRRDPTTGNLSGFEIADDYLGRSALRKVEKLRKGKVDLLVCDDICDGGGTFAGIAEKLKAEGLTDFDHLHLWVTHGIFSKGVDDLLGYYRTIGTTDSWGTWEPDDGEPDTEILRREDGLACTWADRLRVISAGRYTANVIRG